MYTLTYTNYLYYINRRRSTINFQSLFFLRLFHLHSIWRKNTEESGSKVRSLPEEKRAGLFLGRLPKPLLALAILPANEPLDT